MYIYICTSGATSLINNYRSLPVRFLSSTSFRFVIIIKIAGPIDNPFANFTDCDGGARDRVVVLYRTLCAVRYRDYQRCSSLAAPAASTLASQDNEPCLRAGARNILASLPPPFGSRRVACQLFNFEIGRPLQSCGRLDLPGGESE